MWSVKLGMSIRVNQEDVHVCPVNVVYTVLKHQGSVDCTLNYKLAFHVILQRRNACTNDYCSVYYPLCACHVNSASLPT